MLPPTAGPMMGMGPPPTAGFLHSVNMPMGPPMGPPSHMGASFGAPPTAASLGPSMMGGPPMTGAPSMGGLPMGGGLPMPMGGGAPMMGGPMMGGPMMDPHMGSPMHGFGPEMFHNVEVRHAPLRHRPEHAEVPEEQKNVLSHPVHLPGAETHAHGSNKFALYGALEDINAAEMEDQLEKLQRRRRINCIPALSALFVPWVMFLFVFSLTSFYVHYAMPGLVTLLNTAIVVCALGYAYSTLTDTSTSPDRKFYSNYLAYTCLISVALGWLLGDLNFWFNLQPCYNIEHLATYNNVNPSSHPTRSGQIVPTTGKRYQDTGKIYFDHNAKLDLSRAMSFKMGDLYCVAPIVDANCKKNCGYDFWAVGINCCAEDVSDFRCGEYNNPSAKNGLRLMHDEQRPNFRLAVLQAEGVHKMVSTHPIFVYWLHDPVKELSHIKHKGFREFVLLMIVSFFGYAAVAYLSLKWARDKFKLDVPGGR